MGVLAYRLKTGDPIPVDGNKLYAQLEKFGLGHLRLAGNLNKCQATGAWIVAPNIKGAPNANLGDVTAYEWRQVTAHVDIGVPRDGFQPEHARYLNIDLGTPYSITSGLYTWQISAFPASLSQFWGILPQGGTGLVTSWRGAEWLQEVSDRYAKAEDKILPRIDQLATLYVAEDQADFQQYEEIMGSIATSLGGIAQMMQDCAAILRVHYVISEWELAALECFTPETAQKLILTSFYDLPAILSEAAAVKKSEGIPPDTSNTSGGADRVAQVAGTTT